MKLFEESFYGYRFNAEGFHDGINATFRNDHQLLNWVHKNVDAYPELRITDGGDCLVMHFVNKECVFPPRTDGQRIMWDTSIGNFRFVNPQMPAAPEVPNPPSGGCIRCKKPFSDENVKTAAGWAETKISQMCELCFDAITAEHEDPNTPFDVDNQEPF